jgi:CheY-like chemotaxis protein
VDDADTASTYRTLLRLKGMEVRTVLDGPSALAAARDFNPDVVLLDIALPGRKGWKVAQQLRADDRPRFIVDVTGFGREADLWRSGSTCTWSSRSTREIGGAAEAVRGGGPVTQRVDGRCVCCRYGA